MSKRHRKEHQAPEPDRVTIHMEERRDYGSRTAATFVSTSVRPGEDLAGARARARAEALDEMEKFQEFLRGAGRSGRGSSSRREGADLLDAYPPELEAGDEKRATDGQKTQITKALKDAEKKPADGVMRDLRFNQAVDWLEQIRKKGPRRP
ncbi:MAG: hypothetical protein AB1405_03670 [Bdellovibrionota bacterium]